MATENPNLPAPEERVSDAAEDVQTVTSEVTSEVPETEASAAAEAEPVVETPAAEEPETEKIRCGNARGRGARGLAPAAEEPGRNPAAPRAKRARIKPVAEAVETGIRRGRPWPAGAEVGISRTKRAALAAQDVGLELEGETAERGRCRPTGPGSAVRRGQVCREGQGRAGSPSLCVCSKSSPCSRSAGMWRR